MTDMKKVALVTGANKGIGLEIARQLAQAGIAVIMGARNLQRGQDAASDLAKTELDVEAIEIDLTDEASIASAAEKIAAK
ncbi:SDR family NAD(P)-dependent oxidoreductase [Devosia sp. ZW T5_3]|uniref:SDR family NAD(P)-dependent oxidoreductase n=1 Tax=Devosia sp. ZW T5_3 TaxID=3378085 RepID=UPI00385338DE